MASTTSILRIANQDINKYSRNQFGAPWSELDAQQKSDVAASMRVDQQVAAGGIVPPESEAAMAMRLATRALRAADRESACDKDDYALACFGCTFNWLSPAQKEHVASYMRTDEERAFGGVLKGGQASDAKREADTSYASG
ncbi:hypothetical protein DUNSADRAFT_3929 [Dunaliella salina]|uniref:Uncharacterized protein n=1 Tax=Dunaliella salina TaxID=3046 RepID=A0ABQ7H7R8_DUNSA|nr:hypothetical protein DUNSADRAFT_3929 [Dunaliella salina]|eukprot:KAF5842902.1 hypothetical protein DUNSADRAFT_3929 [Dunaliella salina]